MKLADFTKLACLLAIIGLFTGVSAPHGYTQPAPAAAKGLVLYQDPQTKYVEVFDYLSSDPVNAYVTRYVLPGGVTRQARATDILAAIEFPLPGTSMPSAAQMQGSLAELDALAKRYPQYASLLDDATTRLRNALSVAGQTAKPSLRPVQAPASSSRASSPLPASPASARSTAAASLTLKNGVQFQDIKVLHTGEDRFTISHKAGVTDVLFGDLPGEADRLPAEVRPLLKAYQERQTAAAEAEKKRVTVASDTTAQAAPPATPAGQANIITDAAALASDTSSTAVTAPGTGWRGSVLPGLMVKGLIIGMDGKDAAKTLLEQGENKIGVAPTAMLNQHGYDICLVANGHRASGWVGHLRVDAQDGTLTRFVFYGRLSDLLFNTADQGAEEFAQTFINAYDVPTIKPTMVSGLRCWVYDSPQGWTVHIFTDKTIEVLRTPQRSFN